MILPQPFLMVSPAEPPHLRALGNSNPLPEKYGADFLWSTRGQLWGIQRKAFPVDFLASRNHMEKMRVQDPGSETGFREIQVPQDRLAREIQMLQACHERFLLLEGFGTWLPNGFLHDTFAQYTITQLTEFLVSVQVRSDIDLSILWVPSAEHTAEVIRYLVKWSGSHDSTSSLIRRVKPVWGSATSRDWQRHFLMGLEGVGPITADALLDGFDGKLPLRLAAGVDEKRLRKIPGIGPEMARKICALFPEEVIECQSIPSSTIPAPTAAKPAPEPVKAKSRARMRKNPDLNLGVNDHAAG